MGFGLGEKRISDLSEQDIKSATYRPKKCPYAICGAGQSEHSAAVRARSADLSQEGHGRGQRDSLAEHSGRHFTL